MGDSATGGYITPSSGTAYDQELEDIFQAFIVGITSLPGDMVRPLFQRDPPPFPEIGEDWCAFAVKNIKSDDGPYFDQKDETMDSIRHEELTLFLSFYGDHGQSIANVLKDGLGIPQNITQLKAQKIKFISTGELITAPDFLNNQYVHRYDLTAVFKRKTSRTFAVKSFVDAGTIKHSQE
ncbi:phage neck terminator protein [Acinetobacter seifertii]|uniref:phage neck terminator protein n=1 Tax=Acinetobacter seifertii TaxID=1530123 RepID=UPI003AF5D1C6